MKLAALLEHIGIIECIGSMEKDVAGIQFDSRKINANDLFVAQKGVSLDGHRFIDVAIKNGATAIVCEDIPQDIDPKIAYVQVDNTNKALGEIAACFYGLPSSKMKVVGVTGTNGKTSIASLLHRLFRLQGYNTGLLSTISYKINETEEVASHTTPDAIKIQQLMAEMVNEGCEFCFMEVSSHAIHQDRIAGIQFAGGIFTNITHDHLDYHKTFAEYIKAKKAFFDGLPKDAFALVNADDKNGLVMLQNTKARKLTYANRTMADYRCKVIESHIAGY